MRVLIAEDDPVLALGLAERLRALGHEPVGPAHDGEAAVTMALETRPDLLLLDVQMPRLDGLAVVTRLAEHGAAWPIVIVTGVDTPDLVARCVASGVDAFLVKPVDERELDAALRLAAARHGERAALEAEVGRARRALEERKTIERAKGILQAALGLPEDDAFHRLQQIARERNLRLAEVAERIIDARSVLEPARRQ
jgi:response regulator NasT